LRKFLGKSLVLRAVVALAIVLSIDQVLFFAGLHLVANAPLTVLSGNWIAKMVAAVFYSLMLGVYGRWATATPIGFVDQPLTDTFAKLTYRHRYEDLLAKSGIDALTGVLNRGRFDVFARSSVTRAVADRRPISLSVVDVDHFKNINDTYGHLTGDEVLKRVAEILRSSVRVDDKVFRYGGEEFIVLCDGLPHEAALANAERLRSAIPKAMEKDFTIAPTVSIGVATAPNDGADVLALLHRADMRLYEAKRSGRNRVVGNRTDDVKIPGNAV
jgi:diguanylate cyclase (GGDEF)-like protein